MHHCHALRRRRLHAATLNDCTPLRSMGVENLGNLKAAAKAFTRPPSLPLRKRILFSLSGVVTVGRSTAGPIYEPFPLPRHDCRKAHYADHSTLAKYI